MSLKPIIAAVNKEGASRINGISDAKQKKIAELNKKIKNVKKQIDAIKMARVAQKYTRKEEKGALGGGSDPNRAAAMQRGLERAAEAMRQKAMESKPKTPISIETLLVQPPDILQKILNHMDYNDILNLITRTLMYKKRGNSVTGKFDGFLETLNETRKSMILLLDSKFYGELKEIYATRAPKMNTYRIREFSKEVVNDKENEEKETRNLIKARFGPFIKNILKKPGDYKVGDWFVYDIEFRGLFSSCNGFILMPYGRLFDISKFDTIDTEYNIIPCIPAEVIPDEVNATKKLIDACGNAEMPYIAFEFDANNKYAMEEFNREYGPNIKPFVSCIYRIGYTGMFDDDGVREYLFNWSNEPWARYLAIAEASEMYPSQTPLLQAGAGRERGKHVHLPTPHINAQHTSGGRSRRM